MTQYYIRGLSCDMSASSNLLLPCPIVNTKAAVFSEHFSLPKKPHSVTYITDITAVRRNMHVMTLCRQCSTGLFCHSAKTVQAGRNSALKDHWIFVTCKVIYFVLGSAKQETDCSEESESEECELNCNEVVCVLAA